MPCYKQNVKPKNYHIFKAGKWLQLINGYVKEPGKQYPTRLEFTYRTNDCFTLIPFNKVVKAIMLPENGFNNNENGLVNSSFRRKYKNLQRINRRLVRKMAAMERKLGLLKCKSQERKKTVSSCSEPSDSDTTTNACSSESTLDRKIINKIETLNSLCEEKKNENKTVEDKNKSETLEKQNKIQRPNDKKNVVTIKEVVISNATIEMLTRFASKNPEFLECIDKSWANQEKLLKKDNNLLRFLYKVNPLVNVENMNLFMTVIKNNISNVTMTTNKEEEDLIALEDFAAKLGLVDVRKSNILKHVLETRRKGTCKQSVDTNLYRSTHSVSPMDRQARKQRGPFRSEKEKAIADSMSKNVNGYSNGRLRRRQQKQTINYRVRSTNSELSDVSDTVRKKAKLSSENTPITELLTKFKSRLRKQISSDSYNHIEKLKNEIVSGKLFAKLPFDENCDYLKNLQKGHRNVRKKEATSEVGSVSSSVTSSKKKQTDVDIESNQLNKILRENNNVKVHSDFDAITVYNEKDDKTDAENILRTPKRSRRSQMVSYGPHLIKPYSVAEDTMILNFILKNGYENKVKGNAIWKEFEGMSQDKRSWQSLRNRYLRNILRNIKDYSLPPDKERKLRIASCLGSGPIKVKNKSLSPVLLTWNAQRQKQLKTSDELLKKATKDMKANNADAPAAGPSSVTPRSKRLRSDYPTYTQTLKQFSKDHSYSHSDSSIDEDVAQSPKSTRKKLYTAIVH